MEESGKLYAVKAMLHSRPAPTGVPEGWRKDATPPHSSRRCRGRGSQAGTVTSFDRQTDGDSFFGQQVVVAMSVVVVVVGVCVH